MKLPDILNRYPGQPAMRESVRQLHRKQIRESKAPQEGIYWWMPIPRVQGTKPSDPADIKWDLMEFYDSDFEQPLHVEQWPAVLELLAFKWRRDPRGLERVLGMNYTALPRGRVGRVRSKENGNDVVSYTILHGGDAPVSNAIEGVINAFNLRIVKAAGRVHDYVDDHERMGAADTNRLQQVLGVDLGLKKHNQMSKYLGA